MQIEYEATFENIDKDDMRSRLKKAGAKLEREEFMQKRVVFNLPSGHEIPGGWLRVRDEGDRITCSLKIIDGNKIEDQKETQIEVSDFDQTVLLLETMGAERKAFQESKRELWKMGEVEIMIDEWPWLKPFVEIEGPDEEKVQSVSNKLGFKREEAIFCAVGKLYVREFNTTLDKINNETPSIRFGDACPFTK